MGVSKIMAGERHVWSEACVAGGICVVRGMCGQRNLVGGMLPCFTT